MSRTIGAFRAVVFDAVGTLIVPNPSVAEIYSEVGARYGSRYGSEQLHDRFFAAFDAQETLDRSAGWVTDEARELRRWREIVAAVIDDASDPVGCFAELYKRFAQPTSWRCLPGTAEMLAELRARELRIAIASNFDHRLHGLVQGLPELASIDRVFVNSPTI